MDSEKVGTEGVIFAVSFFLSLFILGIFQQGCSSQFCLFIGVLPFVFGTGFALEYDIIYSVKKKEIKRNRRELFLLLLSILCTLQIMCLIGYVIWRGVVIPLQFLIVGCVVIFAVIVFCIARLFENE